MTEALAEINGRAGLKSFDAELRSQAHGFARQPTNPDDGISGLDRLIFLAST